jgi:CP family cyanate transporter-like MFS transporter
MHSPTAIALTVLFGVQSMHAYVQFGWLPQIYRDAGLSASSAGALQALLSGVGIAGALLMPTVIARNHGLRPLGMSFGILLTLGYAGLLVAPATVPWLWALLLGFSGLAFPTAIALITARTRHPSVTAQLSGFVQPVGYALAALGPFLVGLLHDATGDWDLVLVLLALTGVPLALAGLRVARQTFVDDEI